jgi:hypothetical protein
MATDKQIEANRRNAAKSTGPRTPHGRAASSRNALRHGLLSKTVVLQSECPTRFEASVASLYAEHAPVTPTECTLVDTMASARWRLMRLANLEAASVDHELANGPTAATETAELSLPVRTALAYRRATDSGRSLELMNRAEARLQQQFNSALDRLLLLRAARPVSPAPEQAPEDLAA